MTLIGRGVMRKVNANAPCGDQYHRDAWTFKDELPWCPMCAAPAAVEASLIDRLCSLDYDTGNPGEYYRVAIDSLDRDLIVTALTNANHGHRLLPKEEEND